MEGQVKHTALLDTVSRAVLYTVHFGICSRSAYFIHTEHFHTVHTYTYLYQ